jgi:hypothetical protein
MNAKTCQLCGKPLGRIRVGADGDFCSREHRNQYRLRQGMDRLTEANKMASLMRRSEQPKPINPGPVVGKTAAHAAEPQQLKIDAPPNIPTVRWKPSTHMPTGSREMRRVTRSKKGERGSLEFGAHPQPRHKIIPNRDGHKYQLSSAGFKSSVRRTRKVPQLPLGGKRLRVSAAVGFRVIPVHPRAYGASASRRATLVWKDKTHQTAISCPLPAKSRLIPVHMPVSAKQAVPSTGVGAPAVKFSWPALVEQQATAMDIPPLGVRVWRGAWTPRDPLMPKPIAHTGTALRPTALSDIGHGLKVVQSAARVTLAPFVPQETPFGFRSVVKTEVEAQPVAAPAQLEEHFESGWEENWIGGVKDWPIDAAGVRTGSLAFFAPTLEMVDYDLEFLARVDQRSVTWVFRAANFRDYYFAAISTVPGGGYEFTRGFVVDGERQPATAPKRIQREGKGAFNVHLSAIGDDFTVTLDGKVIETWQESMLPAGGVGFLGAPDDRARIYWVRVSPK